MKRAVVLFNLGGPDSLEAVQPFLQNLFSDPAILRLPGLLRAPLARFIAGRRAPVAREIYAQMGGRSPILPETEAQARALSDALEGDGGETLVFIVMRYWHPRAQAVAKAVARFGPDEIVLLPLYPQFSTTTTASSLSEWRIAAREAGLTAPTRAVCCYPLARGFIAAHVAGVKAALHGLPAGLGRRVLFSAHGLPERVVKAGDPYQWQVEQTAAAVAEGAGLARDDWRVTYQSRVGPLKWIGPSTDMEIEQAARAGLALVIVPIAFVSEHSETLVELDLEYRELAARAGASTYVRVPALGAQAAFVEALAGLVRDACAAPAPGIVGQRLCPAQFGACPHRRPEVAA